MNSAICQWSFQTIMQAPQAFFSYTFNSKWDSKELSILFSLQAITSSINHPLMVQCFTRADKTQSRGQPPWKSIELPDQHSISKSRHYKITAINHFSLRCGFCFFFAICRHTKECNYFGNYSCPGMSASCCAFSSWSPTWPSHSLRLKEQRPYYCSLIPPSLSL